MYKLASELKRYYTDKDLVSGRRAAFDSLFIINSDWDDDVKSLANKTWEVAWSYGVILEEHEVIKLLKKYGKFKG